MNLHEYQGKQLFAEYGLPVSKGFACETPEEAAQAADVIGGNRWVVKTQVHAGGRGKAGGVKLVETKDEIREFAKKWLGNNLVTYQTDENGQPVSKILVEGCIGICILEADRVVQFRSWGNVVVITVAQWVTVLIVRIVSAHVFAANDGLRRETVAQG